MELFMHLWSSTTGYSKKRKGSSSTCVVNVISIQAHVSRRKD